MKPVNNTKERLVEDAQDVRPLRHVREQRHEDFTNDKIDIMVATSAFGLATMLMLEDRPLPEVAEVFDFYLSVGLPVTLSDVGLDGGDPHLAGSVGP